MNLTIIYSLNRTSHRIHFAVLKAFYSFSGDHSNIFKIERARQIISIKLLSFTVLSFI